MCQIYTAHNHPSCFSVLTWLRAVIGFVKTWTAQGLQLFGGQPLHYPIECVFEFVPHHSLSIFPSQHYFSWAVISVHNLLTYTGSWKTQNYTKKFSILFNDKSAVEREYVGLPANQTA